MQVLAERERQIREKMERNRQAQEESVKYREQLIQELEEAKQLTQREKEEEAELRTARKRELEAQVGQEQSSKVPCCAWTSWVMCRKWRAAQGLWGPGTRGLCCFWLHKRPSSQNQGWATFCPCRGTKVSAAPVVLFPAVPGGPARLAFLGHREPLRQSCGVRGRAKHQQGVMGGVGWGGSAKLLQSPGSSAEGGGGGSCCGAEWKLHPEKRNGGGGSGGESLKNRGSCCGGARLLPGWGGTHQSLSLPPPFQLTEHQRQEQEELQSQWEEEAAVRLEKQQQEEREQLEARRMAEEGYRNKVRWGSCAFPGHRACFLLLQASLAAPGVQPRLSRGMQEEGAAGTLHGSAGRTS